MLIDNVKIKIESGAGGRGSDATFNNRPVGGNGGKGGDLYFRGSRSIYDLGRFKPMSKYKADNGENGDKQGRSGENAKDFFVDLPLVTTVKFGDKEIVISEDGQIVKALEGGLGEFGNLHLKRNRDLKIAEYRDRGQNMSFVAELILKLQSDVILLGYPNAGKSSLLNALTRTQVKTAPYAFTTIDPQIGLLDGIRIMDLPGLIDGTYEGKGVGLKFLKHTENANLVFHCISLEELDPMVTYNNLRAEIAKIGDDLAVKPEVVILTKSDLVEQDDLKSAIAKFEEIGCEVFACSIIDDQALELVTNRARKASNSL